jgi:hypothetical protein
MQIKNFQLRLASNAKRRRPVYIALKVYFVYLILLVLAPAQPVFPVEWSAVMFWVITVMAAMGGMWASSMRLGEGRKLFEACVDFESLSRYIILISLVGVALAIFDRFALRGVGLAQDAMEARAAIESAGSGVVGMLAAFLSSFAAFGVISTWLADEVSSTIRKKLKALAYINLIVYLYLSIMLGSRSLLLVIFVVHLVAKLLISEQLNKRQFRFFVASVVVLGFVLLTVLVMIFQSRLSVMGMSAIDSIQFSVYAHTLRPTDTVLDFISGNEFLEGFGAAAYSLVLYVFHGFYEFIYMFSNLGAQQTYGATTFWLPVKVAETIFGSFGLLNVESIPNFRSGVFTSFAGGLFVDFSVFAPFAAFAIFFFLSLPNKFVSNGKIEWLFFAIATEVVIIFSPILSLLESASGIYLLTVALILGLFAPKNKIRSV